MQGLAALSITLRRERYPPGSCVMEGFRGAGMYASTARYYRTLYL